MTRRHKINKGAEYEIPFEYAVSRGNVEGINRFVKFSRNETVGVDEVDASDFGDLVYLLTAEKLNVASTSSDDTAAGIGARTIEIKGLDSNYNELSETISLSGVTQVETQNAFLRVYRMRVLTGGTSNTAVGTIDMIDSNTNIQARISIGNNITLMSNYTIPAGKTGLLLYGDASCSAGKSVVAKYKTRNIGSVFEVIQTLEMFENNYLRTFKLPLVIAGKTDIKVTAKSSASGTSVSVNYDIMLIDDTV